jgi:hypothetical protein
LAADLRLLARLFAGILEQDRLRIRLEALEGDGCPRWHADKVGLRLLCTWHGAGTEWLARDGGAALARTLPMGTRLPGMKRIGAGDIAILKGEAFPGHAGHGCIHRSPPRRAGDGPRLLVCLDEPGRIPLA